MTLVQNTVSALRSVLSGEVDVTANADEIKIEGTGSVVAQVLHAGPWSVPTYNRAQHEVIRLNVYADSTRNAFHEPVKEDADQKAYDVYLLADRLLHDVNHELAFVVQSYRRNGPALTLVPETDGKCVLLTAEWEVTL